MNISTSLIKIKTQLFFSLGADIFINDFLVGDIYVSFNVCEFCLTMHFLCFARNMLSSEIEFQIMQWWTLKEQLIITRFIRTYVYIYSYCIA